VKVLVTGGAGYVGSLLCPWLLSWDFKVVVYDTLWFGNGYLPTDNENLKIIEGDIRDTKAFAAACIGVDAVIHLACLSNDYCCQLDEKLSTEINYHAFEPLVIAAKQAGVKRFIYCSSSSVYGVSDAPEITEDHPLVPLTLYNKYKGLCEPLLLKHQSDEFTTVIIRPATVCGYAPRQRFDLTVNIMTLHAVKKQKITVFGGSQKRPNLHIKDMCSVYKVLLEAPSHKIEGEIFNVGRENLTVLEIAKLIAKVVEQEQESINGEIPIVIEPSQDNRSYHVNSDKIKRVLGFEPRFTVENAIHDMCVRFRSGYWKDALTNPIYTNVKQYVDKYGMGNG
jgi:nucleoside-diphosphate-sugar epimerase